MTVRNTFTKTRIGITTRRLEGTPSKIRLGCHEGLIGQLQMKKSTLFIISMCLLVVIISTNIAVYFYFYKRNLESTAVAATYMVALDAMRELSFIQEGIENKNIKQGCFIHGRIDEILSDIESCFNKNYHQCASYGMSVVPAHYFESYMQISKNPTAVSRCSE